MNVLDKWINQSGKKPGDYLFTRRTGGNSKAITPRQFSRLVKLWADNIGFDAVPGEIPLPESPSVGSKTYPHQSQRYFSIANTHPTCVTRPIRVAFGLYRPLRAAFGAERTPRRVFPARALPVLS